MSRHHLHLTFGLAAGMFTVGLLVGCTSDDEKKPIDFSALRQEAPLKPSEDPRVQPHMAQMQRVEALIQRWDDLRANGRNPEAEALEPQIRREVDADFATFERATTSELGPHAQYLAVSALGFSGNPRATGLLVNRLGDRDARLVGNVLIALGVRADPNTPQDIIVARVSPNVPISSKRYAPLALAKIMDARAQANIPVNVAQEQVLLGRIGTIVTDHDPITRLHAVRVLSALRIPGSFEYLRVLAGDPVMRVRWAAAAALERQGDPRGFPQVIRLLSEVAPDSKSVIRDLLISYGAKVQGRPLTQAEQDSLGSGPRAWSQWYSHVMRTRGVNTKDPRAAAKPGARPTLQPQPRVIGR